MNNQQLIQVQRAIERFFYRVKVNIPLHNVMKSSVYKEFNKEMRLAIENQILYFAKIEKVNQIIGVQKADDDWKKRIFVIYPLLQQFIDEQDYQDYLQSVSKVGVKSAKNVLGLDREFIVQNLDKMIGGRVTEAEGWIDDTTVDWLATQLQQGVKEGLDSYEIAKMLRDTAKAQAELRADTIAEQEAAWMLGETQMDVYKQAGVEKKKLITSRDEAVCPICVADEEAGEISITDPFPSGAMSTPIHIHCRCFVMPVTNTPLAVEA